jgi:uncharacterized protein YecT (DUF1311 family)
MKGRYCSILLLALCLTPAIVSAQRSVEAEEACYKAASQVEARACLEKRAAQSEREVREAEAKFRSAIAIEVEESDAPRTALTAFDAASKTYAQYRRAQCDLQASLAFGGTGSRDRRWLCQIELDSGRVADLRRAMALLHKE